MRRLIAKWKTLLPLCLIGAGIALIALAVAADLVGAGVRGSFGKTQVVAVIAGLIVVLGGTVLATPPGQRYLAAASGADIEPAGTLLIAAWFGLLAGWGETLWLVHQYTRGHPVHMGRDFVWMVPLASLVLFAGVGLLLLLLNRRWPKFVSFWVITCTCAFLAYLSVLLLFERLSDWAAVVLAAGLAVQAGRVVARHPQGFHKLVRYSLGWPIILRLGRSANVARAECEADQQHRCVDQALWHSTSLF